MNLRARAWPPQLVQSGGRGGYGGEGRRVREGYVGGGTMVVREKAISLQLC